MKKQKINRYKLVHEVVRVAEEMEQSDRLRGVDKKSTYIKTINEVSKRRNYVVEAHKITADKLNKEDDK